MVNSADSTATATAFAGQTASQSTASVAAATVSNPTTAATSNNNHTASNSGGSQNHHRNGNNNYVDFNQFISQHNIMASNGGGGSAAPANGPGDSSRPSSTSYACDYDRQTQYLNSMPQYNPAAMPGSTSNGLYNYGSTLAYTLPTSFYSSLPNNNYSVEALQHSTLNPFATPYEFVPKFTNLSLGDTEAPAKPQPAKELQQQKQQASENLSNPSATAKAAFATKPQDEQPSTSAMAGRAAFQQPGDRPGTDEAKGPLNQRNRNRRGNKTERDEAPNGANGHQRGPDGLNGGGGGGGGGGGVGGGGSTNSRRNHRERKKYDERRSLDLSRSNTDLSAIGGGGGGGVGATAATNGSPPRAVTASFGARSKKPSYNGYPRPGEGPPNGYGQPDEDDDEAGGGYARRGERDRGDRRNQKGKRSVDNNRSNKRRDDWNRNRDRINGFRVEERYNYDTGKESPVPSPEKVQHQPQQQQQRKPQVDSGKLSQREKLIRDIEQRRLECLVCVEPIKSHQAVWSCHNCYHILHLQCIIKWASASKSDDEGWRCPACQNVLREVPRDYYCFCGKSKNPPYNRFEVAHSCAEVCGRIDGCPHACTLLCHPGPCPPCQAGVRRECGCGRSARQMQCCVKETIECDEVCGKLLNCEVDRCEAKCHQDKCAPCDKKLEQCCHCGKNERQVPCTRDSQEKRTYSCGKPCGRDLACGNHKCKDCCHPGECRPCKQSPEEVVACPCGKRAVPAEQRSSCLDPIPVCEGVCGKVLRCGKAANPHTCVAKCHLGNCPPCNKQTAVKCRCGHMDQMIKCRQLSTRADDARCKKRCVKKRSCGKHKCNQECCIDIDHICPLSCTYTLSCGKHKCDQPCHRGNCPPCYRSSFDELYCECGAQVIYPPVPCGTKRPLCTKPCSRRHPCEHPPQHPCHSSATCPPCMMFTTKWCHGHHEQRKTIPCSQESFSCGLACNKELSCGRHRCIKPCHEGACQAPAEVCKQNCTTARPTCGHKCMAACHEGDCPDTPCKEMVEVQCECGNRKQMRTCADLVREYSRITTAQLASSMAEMQRGNFLELSEILAPVKLNKTNKTLDCNEECRLLERNRRLAIGLQIRNPDLPQKLQTKYTDFTRNFAKRDPALVKSIHDALTNLVKLAKESKQKSRSHSFPTMNREKRQLVHEMCEMFGVESVAYDSEPNRNVVATAYKDRSWLPATSIVEVMQRESGQRRVPVPSNNAWGLKR